MKNLKRNIVSAVLIAAMVISPFLAVKNAFARSRSEAVDLCLSLQASIGNEIEGNTVKCLMDTPASSQCSSAGGTFVGKHSSRENTYVCFFSFEATSTSNPTPTNPGSTPTNPGSTTTNPGSAPSNSSASPNNGSATSDRAAILKTCASQESGGGEGIQCIIMTVVNILSVVIGIAGVIGIVWVGIQYMTAGGNEEKTRKAKQRMFEIVVGLVSYVVIFAALKWLMPGFGS